ncbi:MAG: serine protease [Phenylobacterium sp.]|jgi:serine protease
MTIQNISKVCAAITCALTLSTVTSTAIAAPSQALKLVSAPEVATSGRYIVRFKNTAHNVVSKNTGNSISASATTFSAASAKTALQSKGAKIKLALPKHRAIAVELSAKALTELRNDPSVLDIEVDQPRYLKSLYNDGAGNPNSVQVTPYAIIQSQADQLTLNSGMKVCVIDSGLDSSNADFNRSNITGSNDSGTGQWDVNGGAHGTHVAGTVGAVDNGVGVVGMAPGVPMHIVKVFNADGWGYSSDLAAAADRCTESGANIITMSLGGGAANNTEESAFNTFTDNGGLVLAAAGNDGNSVRSFPAGYKSVMMIGANDADNNIADFSQFPSCTLSGQTDDGYCVEATAGGVNTLSTYPSRAALTATGAAAEATGWSSATVNGAAMSVTGMENLGVVSGSTYNMGTAEATDAGANGKVCIIDRGAISFHDKVQNCENSGGIGAVIVNNVAGVLSGTLGDTNATTIPAIGAALEDRDTWVNATNVDITIEDSMYGFMSGTSMATPGVAGVAALVWSNHTTCTGTDIRNALKATAQDAGAAGKDDYFGHGVVKAKAASDYITANGCDGDTTEPPTPPTGDGIDETVSNIAVKRRKWAHYTLDLTESYSNLTVTISGGTGDADMYVTEGAESTTRNYDCRPYKAGNEESCSFTNPGQGTWHIDIRGYSNVTGLTLNAQAN